MSLLFFSIFPFYDTDTPIVNTATKINPPIAINILLSIFERSTSPQPQLLQKEYSSEKHFLHFGHIFMCFPLAVYDFNPNHANTAAKNTPIALAIIA